MKEKSEFEKRTAEKQVSLLTEALTSAVDAKGHWLNASGKLYPKLYPKGFSVSPFNALVLALDSDAKGCKSNLFTQFSEAKARGESVREHEKGVYVRLLLQDKITLMACRYVALIQVAIAQGFHLFPFRTEKLSLVTPMVLRHSGRVGSCRF